MPFDGFCFQPFARAANGWGSWRGVFDTHQIPCYHLIVNSRIWIITEKADD